MLHSEYFLKYDFESLPMVNIFRVNLPYRELLRVNHHVYHIFTTVLY